MSLINYNSINDIVKNLESQKEKIILEQLNDLISRGLLVVEQTEPALIQSWGSSEIKLEQKVRLTLKDMDYIKQLEDENIKLKEKLTKLQEIFKENL